jgi:hypothetical protein
MRIRADLAVFLFFVLTVSGFGQARESGDQTMQSILTEIRGIHEDMRAAETTQILLTELEMQQGVVNRAMENVDAARSRLLDVQRDQKLVSSDLKRAEDSLSQVSDPNERKAFEQDLERHKANMAALKIEEQGRASTLQEMQERLKTAQDNLDNIENELSAIVKRLRPASM